jgi:hypothetical protein
MSFYACKLPHGLHVEHEGTTIILHGGNIGEELENPSKNGSPRENRQRVYGFGLTELSDKQTDAFESWRKEVTTGPDGAKIKDGFVAFDNGSILGPFKTRAEAEKECGAVSSIVTTGFEGVDPEVEAAKKTGVKVKTRED